MPKCPWYLVLDISCYHYKLLYTTQARMAIGNLLSTIPKPITQESTLVHSSCKPKLSTVLRAVWTQGSFLSKNIFHRTKFQGHFDMNQMPQWMFWTEPDICQACLLQALLTMMETLGDFRSSDHQKASEQPFCSVRMPVLDSILPQSTFRCPSCAGSIPRVYYPQGYWITSNKTLQSP